MKIAENILKILDRCTIEGNTLFLPNEQLDRKTYQDVNKCLESIGGKWNRKVKGHVFDEDPSDLLDNLIMTGETVDLKKEYQYFPTPSDLAKRMVEMAEIKPKHGILEPSAGQGAIADHFPKENDIMLVELNEKNVEVLKSKGYNQVIHGDFLKQIFFVDRIVMNPPFSKQQDVDHVMRAWNCLVDGGILVSIISQSPLFRENKKSIEFRKFLEENNAEIHSLDVGTFKESETMVKTNIIKIKK